VRETPALLLAISSYCAIRYRALVSGVDITSDTVRWHPSRWAHNLLSEALWVHHSSM